MTTEARQGSNPQPTREYRSEYGPQRLSGVLYVWVVAGPVAAVLLAADLRGAETLWLGSWITAGASALTVVTFAINWITSLDHVTVTDAGIAPSRWRNLNVPAGAVAGVEVRRWAPQTRNADDTYELSLALADGRYVRLPMLGRPEHRTRRTLGIRVRDRPGPWKALFQDGAPLRWSVLTDDHAVDFLAAELLDRWGSWGHDAQAAAALGSNHLIDSHAIGPSRVRQHGSSAAWSDSAGPTPRPSWLGEPPSSDWPAIPERARYWSRAAHRLPWRRRSGVEFTARGVELVAHRRRRLVPAHEIEAFDICLCEDNAWRVVLTTVDDGFVELTGMTHGDWSRNPTLLHNELRWSAGDEVGSIPWGTRDDPIVCARLNAQLAASRATA